MEHTLCGIEVELQDLEISLEMGIYKDYII